MPILLPHTGTREKPNPIAVRAVRIARTALGVPYKYGGISYQLGVDCSGLTYIAYQRAGHPIPRTSFEQWKIGEPVERGSEIPGDLVFAYHEAMGPGHVVMSIGSGKVIAADHTGTVVRIEPQSHFDGVYVGSRRVVPSGGSESFITQQGSGSTDVAGAIRGWVQAIVSFGLRTGKILLGILLLLVAIFIAVKL